MKGAMERNGAEIDETNQIKKHMNMLSGFHLKYNS
jgi:hypothetical protein